MVYDPATGRTRVYPIPIPHQGIISVTPDESRGIAYVSTCSDERPVESAHFLILDLATGGYRDLMDTHHMYAFIVLDHLGRAYHPILGGDVARYDPRTGTLTRLRTTIDGRPPSEESMLALAESHPINWEVSPDRKTLYAVAMSGNQLYAYDLTADGDVLPGRRLGPLSAGAKATDCRAMCVGPDGTVWAGVAVTTGQGRSVAPPRPLPAGRSVARRTSGRSPSATPITRRSWTPQGKEKPYHHGVFRLKDRTLVPRYVIMGICAASDGTVYVTTLYPFTVHAIRVPKVAGVATTYFHNSHADMIVSRLIQTDTLDGKGRRPTIELASLFTDQVPATDIGRCLAREQCIPVYDQVRDALTRGTGRLAVNGVLLVAEHGDYPRSATGQTVYPKRRLFVQVLDVFDRNGRVVPVFIDKHLADNWSTRSGSTRRPGGARSR